MNGTVRNERRHLMQMISQYGFALSDIILFLDTHPQNQEALEYYQQVNKRYLAAKKEYERRFGPLTITAGQDESQWNWAIQSWPWERGYC